MSKRRIFWVPIDSYVDGKGYRVSVVVENEPGHQPTGDWPYDGNHGQRLPYFWGHDHDAAMEHCYDANKRLGVSREDTDLIVASSIGAQIKRRRRARKL